MKTQFRFVIGQPVIVCSSEETEPTIDVFYLLCAVLISPLKDPLLFRSNHPTIHDVFIFVDARDVFIVIVVQLRKTTYPSLSDVRARSPQCSGLIWFSWLTVRLKFRYILVFRPLNEVIVKTYLVYAFRVLEVAKGFSLTLWRITNQPQDSLLYRRTLVLFGNGQST